MAKSSKAKRSLQNQATLSILFYAADTKPPPPFLASNVEYEDRRGGVRGTTRVTPVDLNGSKNNAEISSRKVIAICDRILQLSKKKPAIGTIKLRLDETRLIQIFQHRFMSDLGPDDINILRSGFKSRLTSDARLAMDKVAQNKVSVRTIFFEEKDEAQQALKLSLLLSAKQCSNNWSKGGSPMPKPIDVRSLG